MCRGVRGVCIATCETCSLLPGRIHMLKIIYRGVFNHLRSFPSNQMMAPHPLVTGGSMVVANNNAPYPLVTMLNALNNESFSFNLGDEYSTSR